MNPPDERVRVAVNSQEVAFVREVLGEFVDFFHQPMHYPTIEEVNTFLANGAYERLSHAFYEVTDNWLTEEQKRAIDES